MPMIRIPSLIEELSNYVPFDSQESFNLRSLRHFAINTAKPFSRTTVDGHITASAWIVDRRLKHTLLIHHRQMQRWLQPGGHIEDADVDIAFAAKREALEETGLTLEPVAIGSCLPFDVDVHRIPASVNAEAHWHFDLRYLFVADGDDGTSAAVPEEHCRWFGLDEINWLERDAGLARLLFKTRSLAKPYDAGVRFI